MEPEPLTRVAFGDHHPLTCVAPVETVPNELLVSIFQLGRGLTRRTQSEISFPVVASHVSRRWRHVAIHTPALWTNIFACSLQSLGRVEAFILRSAEYNLDITCDWSGRGLAEIYPLWVIADCVDMLARHSHRWREFVFKTDNSLHVDAVVSRLGQIAACRIQALRLLFFNDRQVVPPNRQLFSPNLPSLTTLDLYMPDPGWMPTYANFREIVASCPSLITLILRCLCAYWPGDDQIDPIEIPSLRSLALGDFADNSYYIARILAAISTPALENLELLGLGPGSWHLFELIHERKGRIFPALRSITLLDCEIQKGIIVWMAATFPSVTHLVVLHANLDNIAEMLADRTVYPNNPNGLPIWPELRSCTFMANRPGIRPKTKQLLQNVISSRKSAGMPLAELRCEQTLHDQTSLRGCLQDDVHFALFKRSDYEAYLHRDMVYPNAEENIIGMHRFWSNNLDVNGG
jgi:hypothetical protein